MASLNCTGPDSRRDVPDTVLHPLVDFRDKAGQGLTQPNQGYWGDQFQTATHVLGTILSKRYFCGGQLASARMLLLPCTSYTKKSPSPCEYLHTTTSLHPSTACHHQRPLSSPHLGGRLNGCAAMHPSPLVFLYWSSSRQRP